MNMYLQSLCRFDGQNDSSLYTREPLKGIFDLKQIDPCFIDGNKGLSYVFGFAHLGKPPVLNLHFLRRRFRTTSKPFIRASLAGSLSL